MNRAWFGRFSIALVALSFLPTASSQSHQDPEAELLELIRLDQPYTIVPNDLFERLGWTLPDRGSQVKALAESAENRAFDPNALAKLDAVGLGYRPSWWMHRFSYYGLEWDITGLLLQPADSTPGLPTLVFINGGSANWYEFFVDPLNDPGLAQYMAQKIPVFLITIPGNFKPGGWREPIAERKPSYLLDRELSAEETAARNAMFTFTLISEGVAQLIEKAIEGRVLIAGHSTAGEIQFLLKDRLRSRLHGLSIGWGTGGPANLRRQWDEERRAPDEPRRTYLPTTEVRARNPEGYVSSSYIGPLNPVAGANELEVARRWFERVSGRRPQFKQVIQDLEHRGEIHKKDDMIADLRRAMHDAGMAFDENEIIADFFSTMNIDLTGYRKMISNSGWLDHGHWGPEPASTREVAIARGFREANPNMVYRVIAYETPITHYGHVEKPKQLAGALLAAVKWLMEGERGDTSQRP